MVGGRDEEKAPMAGDKLQGGQDTKRKHDKRTRPCRSFSLSLSLSIYLSPPYTKKKEPPTKRHAFVVG